jgi:hypothetical protein
MKQTYLAGAGASGALLAASAIAFISLAGVVSLTVWPKAGETNGIAIPEIALSEERSAEPAAPAPAPVVEIGEPASGQVAVTNDSRDPGRRSDRPRERSEAPAAVPEAPTSPGIPTSPGSSGDAADTPNPVRSGQGTASDEQPAGGRRQEGRSARGGRGKGSGGNRSRGNEGSTQGQSKAKGRGRGRGHGRAGHGNGHSNGPKNGN